MSGLCYIDGLVSTGNKFPYTILKINFALRINFCFFFINILKWGVDKHESETQKNQIRAQKAFGFNAAFFKKIIKMKPNLKLLRMVAFQTLSLKLNFIL